MSVVAKRGRHRWTGHRGESERVCERCGIRIGYVWAPGRFGGLSLVKAIAFRGEGAWIPVGRGGTKMPPCPPEEEA